MHGDHYTHRRIVAGIADGKRWHRSELRQQDIFHNGTAGVGTAVHRIREAER